MKPESSQSNVVSPLKRWQHSRIAQRAGAFKKQFWGSLFGAVIEKRRPRTAHCRVNGRWMVNFGLCDALGLVFHPDIIRRSQEALSSWGTFHNVSRLYQSPSLYKELEDRLALAVGAPEVVAFNSVTTVHCGVLTTLASLSPCTLFVDQYAHNSLMRASDMCAGRGATVIKFPHSDAAELNRMLEQHPTRYPIVVVDSVFSMHGDFAPLTELHEVVQAHGGLLYIDDAHGTGMYGEMGGGYASQVFGTIPEDVLVVGSLSKVLSGCGGFIACSTEYREFVENAAESYYFNGPIPPAMMAADIAAVDVLLSPTYTDMKRRLHMRQKDVRATIHNAGHSVVQPDSHIISVPMRESEAVATATALFDKGILVNTALFPAVPAQTGIIRLTPSLLHSDSDLTAFAEAFPLRSAAPASAPPPMATAST